jgi:hypothetical protein
MYNTYGRGCPGKLQQGTEELGKTMKKIWLLVTWFSLSVLIASTSCNKAPAAEMELKYDNGSLKEYLPVSAPSFTGYLAVFTPPSIRYMVKKIRINGMVASWGKYEDKAVELQIWDKDKKVVYQASYPVTKLPVNPYDSKTPFHPEDAWVDVDVPDVVMTGLFYVHVHSEDGRWGEFRMGADDTAVNSHSELTVRDGNIDRILEAWPYWRKDAAGHDLWYGDKTKVNWMIRVVGTNSNPQ